MSWLTWEHENNSQSLILCLTVHSFSTESKKTLVQYQEQAEEPPGLEQSLGVQGPDASETVAEKVCGATSQTTGSVFMIKDCTNTGIQ